MKKTFPLRRAQALYLPSLSQVSVILPARPISSSPFALSAAAQHIIVSPRRETAPRREPKSASRSARRPFSAGKQDKAGRQLDAMKCHGFFWWGVGGVVSSRKPLCLFRIKSKHTWQRKRTVPYGMLPEEPGEGGGLICGRRCVIFALLMITAAH